jgi:hypothetical protein
VVKVAVPLLSLLETYFSIFNFGLLFFVSPVRFAGGWKAPGDVT